MPRKQTGYRIRLRGIDFHTKKILRESTWTFKPTKKEAIATVNRWFKNLLPGVRVRILSPTGKVVFEKTKE